MTRIHAIVHGRVQGVGFRFATAAAAEERGLTGWVRNLADGTVETEAEGPADQLANFTEWLHTGPRYARVRRVDVASLADVGGFGFTIRHDG